MQTCLIVVVLAFVAAEESAKDGSIYIIPHAEKNSEGDLSDFGKERARFIATIFPGWKYNRPDSLFAGSYKSGEVDKRTLHTIQPTADNLGLIVDDSIKNEDHSGAAGAFLAAVQRGNVVLAAWEPCDIRNTCYCLADESMCDETFKQDSKNGCDWWEAGGGGYTPYDGVVSFTVKDGKVTAVEHHQEHFTPNFNTTMELV